MVSKNYFLGVDGGQSSTSALIGDEAGRVLGQGRAGPCNHVEAHEGRAKLIAAIQDSVSQACAAAGLDAAVEFTSVCLGFSGGPADKDAMVRDLLRAQRITVTNDAWIALAGATAGRSGVVVIAGTGSIALGRNGGKTARAGGWGYVFGDEGGGFDITRRALRAALRWEEGWGEATVLHSRLLRATGATNANDLMHRMYTPEFSRPRIAGLSLVVEEAAYVGDAVAERILDQAAADLTSIALAVRKELFSPEEAAIISYAGGVFRSAFLLDRFRLQVEAVDRTRVLPPALGPAAGALLEAYREAGLQVTLTDAPEEKE